MFLLRDFFELGSILLLEATYALNGRKTSIAERDRFADADSLLEFGDTEPSGQSLDEAFGQCEAEVELAIAEEVGLPEDDPEREPEDLFEDAGEIAPEDDDSAESDGDAPEPEAITAGSTDEPGTVRS